MSVLDFVSHDFELERTWLTGGVTRLFVPPGANFGGFYWVLGFIGFQIIFI